MEYIKAVLKASGINRSDINKLEFFESRDGFMILDEKAFEDLRLYLSSFPVYGDLLPVMTDDNSNYCCLYISGPLKNMVCHLSHDEISLEPKFRSLTSFIDAIMNHPESYDMDALSDAFDFPIKNGLDGQPGDKEIIVGLYKNLESAAENEDIRTQTAFSIMAFAPPSDIEKNIYPFLDDEDMYVQARAIEILGFHKYLPATDKLKELVISAMPNGRSAAEVVLRIFEVDR